MSSKLVEDDVGDVLVEAFSGSEGDVYAVNLRSGAVSDLVLGLHDAEEPPRVRLLVGRAEIRAATGEFAVAGRAADLVAGGTLDVRLLEDLSRPSLLVSGTAVLSLVSGDAGVAGLPLVESGFVADVGDRYDRVWETAEEYRVRTPPLSEVREALATEVGEAVRDDFDRLLSELPEAPGDGVEIDETAAALLAGARHGELFYDICKWGEAVGFASKATFSQSRRRLEEAGLVSTEKVPVDVGRPRLRLRPGDRLRTDDLPGADGVVERPA